MIPTESLMTFIFASIALGVSPGPDKLYVLTHSALYGRKGGVVVTTGLCTGIICHTTLVAFGVSAILMASPIAFTTLKFAGTFYLMYLAWKAFKASSIDPGASDSQHLTTTQLFFRGIIMNLINPAILVFFFAFLPQFSSPENGSIIRQIYILGILFIMITFVIFSGISIAAGSIQTLFKKSPKAQIYLNRISGIVFLALALKLLTTNLA